MDKRATKKLIGSAIATVGLVASLIAIWQFIPKTKDDERWILPKEAGIVEISSDPNIEAQQIKADEMLIDGARVNVPDGAVITANKISMINGGRIVGRDYAVVATVIEGGAIDASGADGADGSSAGNPGQPGEPGGTIVVATARLTNTAIVADGGDGGNGARGSNGTNGRDGRCDGFGRWRAAVAGGNGGNGGSAGAGGDAGKIYLFHSDEFSVLPEPLARPGRAGNPGMGGSAGRGGRGCTGLGGAQDSASDGRAGASGNAAKDGSEAKPEQKPIDFRRVVDLVEDPANLVGPSGVSRALQEKG